MISRRHVLVLSAIATTVALPTLSIALPRDSADAHAVFVMTNDAESNEVIAYERTTYGTLFNPHRYKTDGRGSGGKVDPLASQGSLTLSQDDSLLFAINAGSGTLSVFRVEGSHLFLWDRVPTDGSETQRRGAARKFGIRAEYGWQQQRRGLPAARRQTRAHPGFIAISQRQRRRFGLRSFQSGRAVPVSHGTHDQSHRCLQRPAGRHVVANHRECQCGCRRVRGSFRAQRNGARVRDRPWRTEQLSDFVLFRSIERNTDADQCKRTYTGNGQLLECGDCGRPFCLHIQFGIFIDLRVCDQQLRRIDAYTGHGRGHQSVGRYKPRYCSERGR